MWRTVDGSFVSDGVPVQPSADFTTRGNLYRTSRENDWADTSRLRLLDSRFAGKKMQVLGKPRRGRGPVAFRIARGEG